MRDVARVAGLSLQTVSRVANGEPNVNDATRELGGTLGVAVVGSVFSSVYAAALTSGAFGGLPERLLARAEESVGAAHAIASAQPGLAPAFRDAFMSGLQTASVVVGVVCVVGALVAALTLPGREVQAPVADEDVDLVDALAAPAV